MILFHAPDDNESIKRYTDIVQRELLDDKRKKHFLIRNISFYVDDILTIVIFWFKKLITSDIFFTENINYLTADGVKFAHPLHHLQKSKEDLPLIAIDSFRHMYLFPKTEEMEVPGKLKQVNICIIYILYLHISYITYYMADSKFDWHLTHHRCMKVIY